MRFWSLFSPCLFGHAEPIKVVRKKKMHFECSRCQADLGVVLPKQKFKVRKAQPERRPSKSLRFRAGKVVGRIW